MHQQEGGAQHRCPSSSGLPWWLCVLTGPQFPRTDPTVIMAIVNVAGDRVLLGRQRRFPEQFVRPALFPGPRADGGQSLYSCLAGFVEPAESVEEAVRRETWEEAGVRVGRVVMHSSQPWPYPNSLMLGCIGEALPGGEEIHLEHDPELQRMSPPPPLRSRDDSH